MNANADRLRALRDVLLFYAESGVDEALLDEPVDRTAQLPPPPAPPASADGRAAAETRPPPRRDRTEGPGDAARATAPVPPPRGNVLASVPDGAQVAHARELARGAGSLEELRRMLGEFNGCNLKFTAKNLCFADGNPDGRLMLVGEAPGREEDLEGRPFVGRSGRLLDLMLKAIGLDRGSVYIANTVPWRPPGNRAPTPLETEICRPFIERQIELANPAVLVALGGPSAKLLLGTSEGIMRLRGKWRAHRTASDREIPTMPALHPAYLLRNPIHKRLAWRDLLEVNAKLRDA